MSIPENRAKNKRQNQQQTLRAVCVLLFDANSAMDANKKNNRNDSVNKKNVDVASVQAFACIYYCYFL